MPSIQLEDRSCRWRLRRRRLLIQPPGIAALFELGDSVVGTQSFLFGQSFFQTANDLPGAPERESDRVPKHFSLGISKEHIENNISSHYILRDLHGGVTTTRRVGLLQVAEHTGRQAAWYFTARDGSPILTAAGLWDEWKDRQTGERLKSWTMIITEPTDFAAETHDRMPVFLKDSNLRRG